MTDTAITGLTPRAFYVHNGMVRIANREGLLVDPTGNDFTQSAVNESTAVLDLPGTDGWCERIIRMMEANLRTIKQINTAHEQQTKHLDALGQALLQQAINRDWCGEYDEFAEEWGLPTRKQEYTVTMTVQVSALTQEAATEIVASGVALDSYSTEGIVCAPSYEVTQPY